MKSNSYIYTPSAVNCLPISVRESNQSVVSPTSICTMDSDSTLLDYRGDEAPSIILDLGPASPGGYPVFKVKEHSDNAVVRITYYDWFELTKGPEAKLYGDSRRGCCKYLGVELPVLPANPNRYELYTITHSGEYIYPLIQGQQRFVRITLDHPGDFVEFEYFCIYYTSDMSPYNGSFRCSDEKLTKLWYSSVYTAQIACFKSDQMEAVNGKLLVRSLSKGADLCYLKNTQLSEYEYEMDVRISYNPDMVSGVMWAIGCNVNKAIVMEVNLDSSFRILKYDDDCYDTLLDYTPLKMTITDNVLYNIRTIVRGENIRVELDGEQIYEGSIESITEGSVGFCHAEEKWAIVERIVFRTTGNAIYDCNQFVSLEDWHYVKSPVFLADGAKRDRLPWSGDLDFAGRNLYYAFTEAPSMVGAIQLFVFHQNPQGYMFATCYPENDIKPASREWGHYESDIFSAWTVIAMADYMLFKNDLGFGNNVCDALYRNLDYLWRYVESDGIFYQRNETSKGLWDHELGDSGRFAYNNLVVYQAMLSGEMIAAQLGQTVKQYELNARAEKMKQAINRTFWDSQAGYFKKSTKDSGSCYMSNSFAMGYAFLTDEQAGKVYKSLKKVGSHGKVVSMAIRGLFRYGYAKEGIEILTGSNQWFDQRCVDWIGMYNDDDVPHTTTECMIYPPSSMGDALDWGDRSHPDTGVAGILSAHILGVTPTQPDFAEYRICPSIEIAESAEGVIPMSGNREIRVSWTREGHAFTMKLYNPKGCTAIIDLSCCTNVRVDQNPCSGPRRITDQGDYMIQAVLSTS